MYPTIKSLWTTTVEVLASEEDEAQEVDEEEAEDMAATGQLLPPHFHLNLRQILTREDLLGAASVLV